MELNDEKKLEVERSVRDDGLAGAGDGGVGQDHDTFFRLVL